ncbi:MAG: Asp-tRNA(Asn)/Glu-tRNA(Gln) amidotransferase GatCAB subunit B [Deltaproteobacteria bacterium CG11_big_fil_rev_8_21_14_0_20_49_13]|nr:MAG: Asp-tRNA(Asn)/Glu-tRNA(Gln) amidotransferase GatCAB subunit B [Deltaproteobacteria bacterium CG11_big_fil_rev_8_21_14_0_20_49_13]
MSYETVIGLEIHAQLLTESKMFCSCRTSFGSEPNTHICPVCTGQPGALPVVNASAVEFAVRAGLATSCRINNTSIFARKNYFYPDLPKGYQISQHDKPLCEHGFINVPNGGRISITRIHMEEDAGKFLHETGNAETSHVDYNRSSIPLIEIVSGPDMRSPATAIAYLKALRNILMYLEICNGNMQEGSFRVDANISIMPKGSDKFGTRTELKNMNSFRAIERALNFEIGRQTKVLEGGGKVIQETLLWNDGKGVTESMRSKEEAHDYRYFPEPDLPPLIITDEWIEMVKKGIPELAEAKAARFVKDLGIPEYDANVLTQDKALADYYEETIKNFNSPKKISNWIMTELLREIKNGEADLSECKIKPQALAKLVEMVETGAISGKIGKTVFEEMHASGRKPEEVIKEKGLAQVSDTSAIEKIIDEVLANNAGSVAKYRSGKAGLFGFFVGETMKATKGRANPKVVNEILKRKLG